MEPALPNGLHGLRHSGLSPSYLDPAPPWLGGWACRLQSLRPRGWHTLTSDRPPAPQPSRALPHQAHTPPIAQAGPTQEGRLGCQPACPLVREPTSTRDLKSLSAEHLLASSLIPRVCESPLNSGCLTPKPRGQPRVTVILVVALSKSSLEDMFDFGGKERNTDLPPPVRTLQGPNLQPPGARDDAPAAPRGQGDCRPL